MWTTGKPRNTGYMYVDNWQAKDYWLHVCGQLASQRILVTCTWTTGKPRIYWLHVCVQLVSQGILVTCKLTTGKPRKTGYMYVDNW